LGKHVARSERWVDVTVPFRTARECSLLPARVDNDWLDGLVGCAVVVSMFGIGVVDEAVSMRQRKRYRQEDLRRR
jgi:hypothetical protein